jgi:hypothetical protein
MLRARYGASISFSMINESNRRQENRHVAPTGIELQSDDPIVGGVGFVQATGRRYTYTAHADRAGRSRRGSLAPGFCVDRNGVEIGRYDDPEIQRQARKLALAKAEKIFRGS